MYQVGFKSRGDSTFSARVVDALKAGGLKSRTLGTMESRGRDGRPSMPGTGVCRTRLNLIEHLQIFDS